MWGDLLLRLLLITDILFSFSQGSAEEENDANQDEKSSVRKLAANSDIKLDTKVSSSSSSSVMEMNVDVEEGKKGVKEGEREGEKEKEKEGEKEVLTSPPAEKANGRMDMFFTKVSKHSKCRKIIININN